MIDPMDAVRHAVAVEGLAPHPEEVEALAGVYELVRQTAEQVHAVDGTGRIGDHPTHD